MANYNSSHTGSQIDSAVTKALNPDTAVTSGSSQLITSDAVAVAIAAAGDFGAPIAIASGDYLNSLITPGIYRCSSTAVASSLGNLPTDPAFVAAPFAMFVLALSVQAQTCIQVLITAAVVFVRWRQSGGIYTDWRNVGRVTGSTSTTINGVLRGDGSTVGVAPVDNVPVAANTDHLISSAAVYAATKRSASFVLADGDSKTVTFAPNDMAIVYTSNWAQVNIYCSTIGVSLNVISSASGITIAKTNDFEVTISNSSGAARKVIISMAEGTPPSV